MNKKIISLALSMLTTAGILTGCGNKNNLIQNKPIIKNQQDDNQVKSNNLPYFNLIDEKDYYKSFSYQQILTEWDIEKNDNGLTLEELMYHADINKDNKLTSVELANKGFDNKSIDLIINKVKNLAENDNVIFKLVELDSRVFPGGVENISISDIQQGKRNVCYFLSSLASLAHNKRSQEILNMIEKNRDGTFTITFPGIKGNKNSFTVDYPSEKDFNELIHKGKNGSSWAAIFVNAYNKYATSGGRPFKHSLAKDFASDYGLTWEGIEVQTGHNTDSYLLDFSNTDKLLTEVKKALDENRLVTICTFLKGNSISNPFRPKKDQIKFSKAHILTLTGVDLTEKTVTIRDPYGKYEYFDKNGKVISIDNTDGFMTLSVKELKKYFLDLSIELETDGKFEGIRDIFKRFL